MKNQIPLLSGNFYHIYNRANGKDNLFRKDVDYLKFLELYKKYIVPIADTWAWVLMANHFHVLVYIKEGMYYKFSKEDFSNSNARSEDISTSNADGSAATVRFNGVRSFDDVKWETINLSSTGSDSINGNKRKKADPSKHFYHLCNAYAVYINNCYGRHGSLFQRPFKRKLVDNNNYLTDLIVYIHQNPVNHGFVKHPGDYRWSSFNSCLSEKTTNFKREKVISWFGGIEFFLKAHSKLIDSSNIDRDLDLC